MEINCSCGLTPKTCCETLKDTTNAREGPFMTHDATTDGQQEELLSGKDNPTTWVSHPIDIRISLPFLHTRFYFTIVAGRERRPAHRRKAERHQFPVLTVGNALFALGLATLFTMMGLAVLIARSAIIEY